MIRYLIKLQILKITVINVVDLLLMFFGANI